jgi:phosphoribosylglycinamide formyltransferase-1
MTERFLSVAIQPVTESSDTARMALGEPGLPREFLWKGQTVRIVEVLRAWRDTGPCRHGSGEAYVRKHWFEVVTDAGQKLKIYFERQPRTRGRNTNRWWLFSMEDPD